MEKLEKYLNKKTDEGQIKAKKSDRLKNVPVDVMYENNELVITSKAGMGDRGLRFYVAVPLSFPGKQNGMWQWPEGHKFKNRKAEIVWMA